MALMFGAKIKTKIQTPKYSCTYLCTRHKKLAFFTLTLPPNPPGGCSAFSLQFIPFRIVFFGRSPLKTDALSIAWYVICLSKSINYY